MKATLIVIQNDTDHAQAKALIETLINSKDPANQGRMVAQAFVLKCPETWTCHGVGYRHF